MAKLTQTDITTALASAKARWRAAPTPVSLLDEAKQKALLGAIPSPEVSAMMAARATAAPQAAPPAFALEVDWRNKGGNHVTAVGNQGGCGSCVSFGCVAVVESMAHIEKGAWVNLSEADSHFCSSHGPNCNGWWPDQCLDQIKTRGACDEACFPYASAFPGNNIWGGGPPTCTACANRNARAVKITNRVQCLDATSAKNYLSSTGPLAGCIDVYQDFFSYSGGVYHHVTGGLAGGHCIEVIGYSESEQCWIIKNSWDTTWGVGGFAKIAYSDFKFGGQFYPMYGATGVVLPNTGFQSLGGVLTSRVAVGRNKDGRLEVFARGTDNALWHIWQLVPNGTWSGWASLGGTIAGDPQVVSNADGRLEVFARGPGNALVHIWQTAPNNGWSAWTSLGGIITSNPGCGRNKDGRVEVFARGTNGALWHIWQTAPNNGWSGWTSLGVQLIGNPVVANNQDGRLEVFFRGPTNALVHIWQTAPNNGWSGWASLGGVLTSDPAVAMNKDGRLEVFVRGTDGACWHIWQVAPNSFWSGWVSLGGVLTSGFTAVPNKDGRLEVFARGTNSALWHIWQTAPNNGWSGWTSLGGTLADGPVAASNADGRLEVFARGSALNLIHTWQTAPNNGWN